MKICKHEHGPDNQYSAYFCDLPGNDMDFERCTEEEECFEEEDGDES